MSIHVKGNGFCSGLPLQYWEETNTAAKKYKYVELKKYKEDLLKDTAY